ncbi:MAG: hypothetical protein WC720_05405 [Candidatus Shapirobacteria bacterium]|jgi:hypothetical protein
MVYNSKDRARMLDLKVYELLTELNKRGKDTATVIWIDKKELIDVVKSNFIGDFEYILEELRFIKKIAETFYLNLTTIKHIEELEELNTKDFDTIVNKFMPINFSVELQRFYTDKEEEIRNMKKNELAIKIINKMKKEGRI